MDPGSVSTLLGADVAAAATSAAFVAPVVAAIDRAVVENGLPGRKSLRALAACALTQPHRYFRPRLLAIVWTLYAATYAAANTAETAARDVLRDPDPAAVGTATFVSTLVVNTPLGLWKDVRFTQAYGLVAAAAMAPRSSATMAAFLLRDAVTVFGSFTLAPQMAAAIPDGLAAHAQTKATLTQLLVPSLTQLAATPAHLLGLDLYSRPRVASLADRLRGCTRHLASATAMRCLRILPAFGFGCVGNTALRRYFRGEGWAVPDASVDQTR